MNTQKWIQHFKKNKLARPEPDWSIPSKIPPHVLMHLVPSLEQFQLGDGGGPASLIAHDAGRFRNSSREMREIVDLWFEEEKEHSRLLGCAVERFGGRRIYSHWSFSAFCFCRRVLGVKFELQVLLLTEIVSHAYYRVMRRHAGDAALQDMCNLIIRDETSHIAFHLDRVTEQRASSGFLAGLFYELQFTICGFAAASMLYVNHGKCQRALGATTGEYFQEVRWGIGRFLRKLSARQMIPKERWVTAGKPAATAAVV